MVSKQIRCWLRNPSGIHFNKQTDPHLIAIRHRHGSVRQQSAVHTPAHLAAGLLLADSWALKQNIQYFNFQLSTLTINARPAGNRGIPGRIEIFCHNTAPLPMMSWR